MMEKPQPDLSTLSTTFFDLSFSRNLFSKTEMRQFDAVGAEGLNKHFSIIVLKLLKV